MKQTVIIINHGELRAGVSTSNRKWVNRLEQLVTANVAEEVESEVEGNREWEVDVKCIRPPVNRKVRVLTKAQKKAAIERLAKVREAVVAARAEEAEAAAKVSKKKVSAPQTAKQAAKDSLKVITKKTLKKATKKVEEELEDELEDDVTEEEEDDDLDDDDLDEDEDE